MWGVGFRGLGSRSLGLTGSGVNARMRSSLQHLIKIMRALYLMRFRV